LGKLGTLFDGGEWIRRSGRLIKTRVVVLRRATLKNLKKQNANSFGTVAYA